MLPPARRFSQRTCQSTAQGLHCAGFSRHRWRGPDRHRRSDDKTVLSFADAAPPSDGLVPCSPVPVGRSVDQTLAEFEAQTGRVGQSFRVALAIPTKATGLIAGSTMTVVPGCRRSTPTRSSPGAILARADGAVDVMVFRPAERETGTVERHAVAVCAPRDTPFEVDGLAFGERIVAAGGHLLREGKTVPIACLSFVKQSAERGIPRSPAAELQRLACEPQARRPDMATGMA